MCQIIRIAIINFDYYFIYSIILRKEIQGLIASNDLLYGSSPLHKGLTKFHIALESIKQIK
jgi:hypothetical protein